MLFNDGRAGFLTTIIGPMFSEKSGELIKRCKQAQQYQGKKVMVYKPDIDVRFSVSEVVSRIGLSIPAHMLPQDLSVEFVRQRIYVDTAQCDIVAFDEAQFFSAELVDVVQHLIDEGKMVIVAGLNLDYQNKPFGHINNILLFSDEVIVKNAYCACCGRPAMYTQRLLNGVPYVEEQIDNILVGDKESYEPRCRLCYVRPKKNK